MRGRRILNKERPRPPRYKKRDGTFILIFTNQQIRVDGDQLIFPKIAGLKLNTSIRRE